MYPCIIHVPGISISPETPVQNIIPSEPSVNSVAVLANLVPVGFLK